MAQRLLDALRQITNPTRRIPPIGLRLLAATVLLAVLSLALVWFVEAYPVQASRSGLLQAAQTMGLVSAAQCSGLCQACYCEDIVNGQCYVNGRPSGCIGCVGSCTSPGQCQCRAGLGGCGRYVMWCRSQDCIPQEPPTATPTPTAIPPTPTPMATPTPTPPPPACDVGRIWVDLEKPRLTQVRWEPPFPILNSQYQTDPEPGVDFFTWAAGGRATQYETVLEQQCRNAGAFPADCPNNWRWACYDKITEGPYDDPIVRLDIHLPLSDGSSAWIGQELRGRYYDAYKRQDPFAQIYPMHVWTGEAMSLYDEFLDWRPEDPGTYAGRWVITSKGTPLNQPQTAIEPYTVLVYLRDTTLTEP